MDQTTPCAYFSRSWALVAKAGFLLGLNLLFAISGRAQQAGLSGFVRDPSGAVVRGARLTFTNQDTNAERRTNSNDAGLYSLPDLAPGRYELTVVSPGFQKLVRTGVTLEVAQQAQLDLQLALGTSAQTVTVEADAPMVNTTDGSVSMTVSRDFIDNMPLNGRSLQELITLSPGINLIGGTGSTNTQPLGEFTVNGQRATANYFTVDGVSANIGITPGNGNVGVGVGGGLNAAGGTNAMVSVDALQEFHILTSSFAPEYGRTPGAQVILLTRSGTNQLHGSLYDYFRNTVLDANDWFANQVGQPRSPLQFNDFGGTFGGPILRNNTFFFFSYEGQRLLQPQFAITSVPDVASRSAATPQMQVILNAFPLPNGPELGGGLAQFAAGYSNPINTNATSIRLDHSFSSKLSAFARYSYAPSASEVRQPDNNLASIYRNSQSAQTLTVGATYVITPRLINEFRLNLSDNSLEPVYIQDGFGGATPPSDSALFVSPVSAANASSFVYSNWGELAQGKWLGLEQRQINLTDGLSWTVGTHQFKLGLDELQQFPIYTGEQYDYYFFTNVASVSEPVPTFGFASVAPIHSDVTRFSFYAQDTWHLSPRLVVTYGLRWDFNPPPRSHQDYVPIYLDSAGNVSVGKAGSSYWDTQYKNFAPRLGVAYTLRHVPGWETVVRGGIGLFYDLGTEAATNADYSGFPNLLRYSTSNVSFPVPPQQVVLPAVDLGNPPSGSSFTTFARNFASPRTWEWNISVQQALGSAQTLSVSYVAALGRDLVYGQRYDSIGSEDYFLLFYNNAGTSDYQSLQVLYQRRLSRGLSATAAYTWGHSIDTNSDNLANYSLPNSTVNANTDRGASDFDIRHSFSGAVSYSLPGYGGSRLLAGLSKEWGLDAIISARSALPVDIFSYYPSPFGYYYLRPDLVPGVPLYVADSNVPGGKVINSAAFVANASGQGDLGRNALRGFDLLETDLTARRSFHISERFKLLFRADLFNLFNHPNFANPNDILGRSFFGQSTAMANSSVGGSGSSGNSALNSAFQTGGPRTAQLSLKLQF